MVVVVWMFSFTSVAVPIYKRNEGVYLISSWSSRILDEEEVHAMSPRIVLEVQEDFPDSFDKIPRKVSGSVSWNLVS